MLAARHCQEGNSGFAAIYIMRNTVSLQDEGSEKKIDQAKKAFSWRHGSIGAVTQVLYYKKM